MFKGIQKTSMVDFPGRIATTLFTGGCNFRCPWCHNLDLVYPEKVAKLPQIATSEVLEFLHTRVGKIEGVCVTGGEPTLWDKELLGFFLQTNKMGFKNKLDTNGYKPDVLKRFLESGVIDFVAMDIKNIPERYAQTVGLSFVDIDKINRSIKLIKDSGIEHEFRTTQVSDLVTDEDIELIKEWIKEPIRVQMYRNVSS